MANLQEFSAILETHYYGVNGSAIKYTTRNVCADATAKIFEEMARILFPNEEVEIYVLPAQEGSHKDSFWIKLTNNATVATVAGVLLTAFFAYPLTSSQIGVNQSQEELNKLQIEQLKRELGETEIKTSFTQEQYQKLVKNSEIKKNRNKHFQQLQTDGEIKKEKFVAKSGNTIISEKIIESNDFGKYVENLPQTIIVKMVEKIHNLTVIKSVNDEEYRDLMWIVEDVNGNEKFGVHMIDEKFYAFHLKNVLGIKNLIARVRYTVHENQTGEQIIKNKEVIVVYSYNGISKFPLPYNENIEPAPLELWNTNKDDFRIKEKESAKKETINENQLSMF